MSDFSDPYPYNPPLIAPAGPPQSPLRLYMPGGKLAKALASAQAELVNPTKNKKGTVRGRTKDGQPYSYDYSYADFGDALHKIRPVLAKHGVAFVQIPISEEIGVRLVTRIMFEDEWMEGDYPIWHAAPGQKNQATGGIFGHQDFGGALSYAKRYALFSILGISGEDDTGEGRDGADESISRQTVAPPVQSKGKKSSPVSDRAKAEPKAPEGGVEVTVEGSRIAKGTLIEKLFKVENRDELIAWRRESDDLIRQLTSDDYAAVREVFSEVQDRVKDILAEGHENDEVAA